MYKLFHIRVALIATSTAMNVVNASPLHKRYIDPQAMKKMPGWAIALIVLAPFIVSAIVVCIIIAYKQRQIRKRTLKTSQLLGSNDYLATHQNMNHSTATRHELTTLVPDVQPSVDQTVITVPMPAATNPPDYTGTDNNTTPVSTQV